MRMLLRSTRRLCDLIFRQGFSTAAEEKPKEAACGPCIPDLLAVDPKCPQPKVVIIGAGIAGLSAAERLIQCGITDVLVLEALPRIGGRIHSLLEDGSAYELGASLIYGSSPGNTMYTLASQEKVLRKAAGAGSRVYMDCRGRPLRPIVCAAARTMFREIERDAKREVGRQPFDRDVWTFFSGKIERVNKYFPEHDRAAAKAVMYAMTSNVKKKYSAELRCLPLAKYGLKSDVPGDALTIKSGMVTTLAPLVRAITEPRIKLNKVVDKIFWDPRLTHGPSRALVCTCDKSKYPADYVITTLPLGVLKHFSPRELFDPPLPERKMRAIRRIEQGHMNCVCLKYKKPFWVPGEGTFLTCWPVDKITKGEHWTHSISEVNEIPNNSDTLKITVAGNAAIQMEDLSDKQLICDVTETIRNFLGDPSLPGPSQVYRSHWTSDRRFLGGGSYLGEAGSLEEMAELGRPLAAGEVAPTLLFAGEATAPGHFASLHGARLSGLREADRILRHTKCFCGPPPKAPKSCDFCG